MGFTLKGYALEPPRVGGANSPFTMTPNVFVSDNGAYTTAYPVTETNARTDYLVLVLTDGKLPNATFGWTKNEALSPSGTPLKRFDYDGRTQSFRPLKGSAPQLIGTVASTLNTTRLKVAVPTTGLGSYRLSVGPTGSGTTLTVSLVTSFTTPSVGTVQLLTQGANAGELHWNSADLVTYNGQPIKFQRQSFFTSNESNGKLGTIANSALMLTPIPSTGQFPLIRIGYGLWLIADEMANEASFSSNPISGHVEWARTTGMLKFNSTDLVTFAGKGVYYDGVLMARDLALPRQSLGTINASGTTTPQATTISSVPTSGGDIIFRVPGVTQFPESVLVTAFDPVGKQGQVQYNAGGQVQISLADRTKYGGQTLQVVFGDLPLERGISMRFFRTPVDLSDADVTVKDVTSVYGVIDAEWANPIVEMPQVFLPSTPIDAAGYPITISITKGTGSFVGDLPRLDVANPPAGLGYVVDFDQGLFQYAKRNNDILVPIDTATSVGVLPDPLLVDAQLNFQLETAPSSGLYTSLVRDVDYLIDLQAGHVLFTTTSGVLRTSGTLGSTNGTVTFSDTTAGFIAAGVLLGDYLLIKEGAAEGVYTITGLSTTQLTLDLAAAAGTELTYEIRSGKEVLADRYFEEVLVVDPDTKIERIRLLDTVSNSPRLTVTDQSNVSRFRFGTGSFSQPVQIVANDDAFTAPGSLSAGIVELSAATGNLNFSSSDVTGGLDVYVVRKLTQGTDYRISPTLGFIEFTERMLTGEEALITYSSSLNPDVMLEESATFLVRKEQAADRSNPVSTVSFNPEGHRVALNPLPNVFRGGRPQTVGKHVTIDTTNSKVTFLSDNQLTDALPHGAIVAPNERILIDYYIYDALGGEKTTNVLSPPMELARVVLTQGEDSFTIAGNFAAKFPAGHLLRVGNDHVYLIASSTYNGTDTTVSLAGSQTFFEDSVDPKLYVSSGETPIASALYTPAYFTTELSAYDSVPRGMNIVKVAGDRTSAYKSDTVLLVTDGVKIDTYRVSGSKYESKTNRTEISLTSNVVRQYTTQTLKYSARPIFPEAPTSASTSLNPQLTFPTDPTTLQYSVFRRVEGEIGELLTSPTDYTIDNSGVVKLTSALTPNEELAVFYTGLKTVSAGLRLKASYTNITSPNASNGILNQILLADYSIFSPDSFYFRVESMTNFRKETASDISDQATSSSPSGGPQTSNTGSSELITSGRDSLFYGEGHYANQDVIARTILKFYNDAVNYLEDALHYMDGRVVGDRHGRFKFDGSITNPTRTTISSVTNQIDDLFRISPFPSPDGTTQSIYQNSPYSRFYSTRRNLFAGPTVAGTNDGDPIAKVAFKNLASVPGEARRRSPRAQIMRNYAAGTTTFEVDNATGTSDALLRPAFINGMRVVIQDAAGTFYIDAAANVTVSSTAVGPPQTITLSGGPASAVPAGATIFLSPSDASSVLSDGAQSGYAMVYKFGKDINANLDSGELLWVKRVPPYDGSQSTTVYPKSTWINEVATGDILQCTGAGVNPTGTEPYKFPALTGAVTDDDGDQAVPMVCRTFDGEIATPTTGALNDEKLIVQTSTGTIRTSTTAPYVGTGSLDATRTIITDTVSYAGTLPQVDDIVRILTGTNGATSFRRITAVGADTVTVDSAFTLQDSNFSYTIALSALSITGTATLSGTSLTDVAATFLSNGAKVGHTVVLTSGTDVGRRRQIVAINSNTSLTLSSSFPVAASETYRIDDALGTFGGTNSIQASLSTYLATSVAALTAEQTAINSFFSTVLTAVVTSSTGVTSGTTFSDSSANFLTSSVDATHFIYITSGVLTGFYQIASVNSATQITVSSAFAQALSSQSYQIVSSFGVTLTTLQELIAIRLASATLLTSTQSFQSVVDTSISVLRAGVADSGAFARGLLTTDLNTRATDVANRITTLTDSASGPIGKIQSILSGTERLYDKRYTWVDARINLEKGLLVRQKRAVTDRIKAQADILKQLTKLLAVKV